ncbi:reverse transcriptase domain-containing protein [Tanacetum coccineum]
MRCLKTSIKFDESFDGLGHWTLWARSRLSRGFGAPRAIISDRGTHFCNDQFARSCRNMELHSQFLHCGSIHKQIVGKSRVSNRGLKRILEMSIGEKTVPFLVGKLDDALWAFAQLTITPIGIARIVKALGFVYSITRASNPQLHFGNPDI